MSNCLEHIHIHGQKVYQIHHSTVVYINQLFVKLLIMFFLIVIRIVIIIHVNQV